MEALPINKDHPIRFITSNWGTSGGDLTQEQWTEVRRRVVAMLQECELQMIGAVGPGEYLETCDEAIEALDHHVKISDRDRLDMNLPIAEKKHIFALQWAFRTLTKAGVIELRIKKIIGAGLTCLNEGKVLLGDSKERVGIAVTKIPKRGGNEILTECMKAYRVLDEVCHWSIHGFEEDETCLWKMINGRNYLACYAMIDMQVDAWVEKANRHLNDNGLAGVRGLLLNEEDILSRSTLLNMEPTDDVSIYIKALTSKIPRAVNNDGMIPSDVGFATAGGKFLTMLAPMMFVKAQMGKSECAWRLMGDAYQIAWLTVGSELAAPLATDVGWMVIQSCQNGIDFQPGQLELPDLVDFYQISEVILYNRQTRQTYVDPSDIPSIDE